jgi:hypothetical protein
MPPFLIRWGNTILAVILTLFTLAGSVLGVFEKD